MDTELEQDYLNKEKYSDNQIEELREIIEVNKAIIEQKDAIIKEQEKIIAKQNKFQSTLRW